MAEKGVLLSIRTKLAGATDLMSAISMVKNLTGSVIAFVKAQDKFAASMRTANMELANFADSASKGQVDTAKLIGIQQKLSLVTNLTKEQLAAVTVAGTKYAQMIGGDATQETEKLTKALVSGRAEGLVKYGISLKSTGDKMKDVENAVAAVTARFGEQSVELTTSSEHMYALTNNIGTMIGALWNASPGSPSLFGALTATNNVLSEFNSLLTEAPETMGNWLFSFQSVFATATEISISFINGLAGVAGWMEKLFGVSNAPLSSSLGNLASSMAAEQTQSATALFKRVEAERQKTREEAKRRAAETKRMNAMGRVGGKGAAKKQPDFIDTLGDYGQREIDFGPSSERIEEMEAETNIAMMSEAELQASMRGDFFRERREQYVEAIRSAHDERILRIEQLADVETNLQQLREEERVRRMEDDIVQAYQREKSLEFGREFRDTWVEAFGDVSSGAMVARGAFDLFRGGVEMSMHALITGSGASKDAFLNMISGIMEGLAIEAAIKALFEAGEAIAAAVSYRYDEASQHAAAAGIYTAVAAAAGAVAGATYQEPHSANSGRGSTPYGYSGYSATPASPDRREEQQRQVNVVIVMDDSAAGFRAIVEGNDAAIARGDRALMER